MSLRRASSFLGWSLRATLALTPLLSACESSDPSCRPGAESCACASPDRCDDGLVCGDGICRSPRIVGLDVPSGAAACEILLIDGDAEITGVRFAEGVLGAHVREEPRTSVSLAAGGPGALPGRAASLEVLGDGDAASIARTACVDASGALLEGTARVGG